MACSIKIDTEKYKALDELYKYCGSNCSKFYNYITTVIKNINTNGELEFSPDFLAVKGNSDLNPISSNPKKVKDKVIQYFNSKYPSVRDGVRKSKEFDKVAMFGYDSVGTRELGKRLFANKMIEEYHNIKNTRKSTKKENLTSQCAKRAMQKFTQTLAKRLETVTGIRKEEIYKNISKSNNSKYITDILKGHEGAINSTLENLIALHREYTSVDLYEGLNIEKKDNTVDVNPYRDFIREVINDSRLSEIRLDKLDEDEEQEQTAQAEESEEDKDSDTETQTKDGEYDTLIRSLNNKLGLTTTYMTHVGAPLRALLGSLKKMSTTDEKDGDFTLDTDNAFGIADVMDANQCATVLYHYGQYENIPQMMDSILQIANQLPGFAAFKELHAILKANPNLQLQFHRTFGKMVMGKLETVIENGVSISRISNRESIDRESILRFRFMNALKNTSLDNDIVLQNMDVEAFKTELRKYKELDDTDGSRFRSLCDSLTELLKRYYPTINNLEIRNFVQFKTNTRGVVNRKNNITNLVQLLESTIKEADKTKENYNEKQAQLSIIRSRNWQAKKDGRTEDIIDLDPIYAEGYITSGAEAAAIQLTTLLLPYTLVSAPLNSRNASGNQSSDVINSSLLTQIQSTLQSELNKATVHKDGTVTWSKNSPIVRLGEHKSKTKQYDFSPIILEHRDEKGEIINYGLFRNESGKFVPTNYCKDLLSISLFNGASNFDDGTNNLYSGMSKGDYIGTAWRNFFHSVNSISGVDQKVGGVADYFMRIPSDAPKNFVITAPRYLTKGLISIGNRTEINNEISSFFTQLNGKVLDSINSAKLNDFPINVAKHSKYLNLSDFLSHVRATEERTVDIKLPKGKEDSLRLNQGRKIKLAFRYSPVGTGKRTENVYVMEGTYENGVLKNAHFVGFKKDSIDPDIWDDLRSKIWEEKNKASVKDGGIQWNFDTNHRVFRQFRNIFKQELTDMAVAANVMFETVTDRQTGNKRIKVDDAGRPVLKRRSSIIKSNTEYNGLHPVYHFADSEKRGKGPIYVEKDGQYKLTGRVFQSDKFVLYNFDDSTDNETDKVRNYGQDIINRAFNPLTTRTSDANLILQFDDNGNVILTKDQEKVIDEVLQEFILDYIESARVRLSSMSDFVEEEKLDLNTSNITEFVLNYHLAYSGFGDLFEGNSKFYKDTQTFLKRAKEVQGSGVPYGGWDLTKPIQPNYEVGDVIISSKLLTVHSQNCFRGLTIYNTVNTNKAMLESLVTKLTDKEQMGDKVLTDKKARELLFGKKGDGGYTEVTVNDAQSYITFAEWIRRITLRGQLDEYKPLIDKILDDSQELTINDIEKFVQVQKNFYYDHYYNAETKTISPRQIKNAEFVLVTRFVRGTQLEVVAKLMDRLGIDQLNTVETSKAGQSRRYNIWDDEGHFNEDILNDINNNPERYASDIMRNGKAGIENYSYSNLYTQQEAAQHVYDENKAGIQLMKKIVDNIDENAPQHLKKAKADFFELYSANIRDSFNNLMDRFGVVLDDNDNLKLNDDGTIPTRKIDEDGNVIEKGVDYNVFYEALKDELVRLGLDSNMLDYCTLNEYAIMPYDTIMPNFMSLVASKFENIVQSLFNHNITRQTLPGFHAAQVSGMGFKLTDVVDKKMTDNDLQYHPNIYKNKEGNQITQREYNRLTASEKKEYTFSHVADYIEVRLPANNFGFDRTKFANLSKEEQDHLFLVQLQRAGADTILGYRIPTEGKQSIFNMKIVGFTDDAQGSTIIIPDDLVGQTGSDFDFDSIYGVQYFTYVDKTGNLRKPEFIDDYRTLYNKYVLSKLSKERVDELFQESDLGSARIEEIKDEIRGDDGRYDKEELWRIIKDTSADILNVSLEDEAEELGLDSFEEFKKKDINLLNSRNARNNKLLDLMKLMLTDNYSLEENLSRSNFDDIKDSLKKYSEINARNSAQRSARSAYNILDQAEYQEDAMSGAKLKAISVVRDNFCSLCNTLQPTLEHHSAIKIFYSEEDYTKAELEKSFDKVDPVKGGYIVTHNTLGWTRNNRNVEGRLLTPYSSETTAHILDAIKTGNIPNVNDLTFHVYKTFFDIGSNSDTAISFMMQPGITRIINAYNKTNSIYSKERGREYVLTAVKDIASDLQIEFDDSANIKSIISAINHKYGGRLDRILGKGKVFSVKDEDNANIILSARRQEDRLAERGMFDSSSPVGSDGLTSNELRLLYDLQTVLTYNKINNLAEDINTATRVSNPDKFGAKQSIFATRKVLRDLVDSIQADNRTDRNNTEDEENSTAFRLRVEGKHLLTSLYPHLEDVKDEDDALNKILSDPDFVTSSKYQPLAAFLKYATCTSIKINKTLFITQSDEFVDFVMSLEDRIGNGSHITEKVAKEFQNYIINDVILQSDFIQAPLHYNYGKGKARGFDYNGLGTREYNGDEAGRVFGYDCDPSIMVNTTKIAEDGHTYHVKYPFIVENIKNPTQDEIDDFCSLSPAQKITWIKRHYRDAGVFNYVDVSLFNDATSGNKLGTQTCKFSEEAADIETVRKEFGEAFSSTDPFVACAAADLIKYAFIVEGYRMGMRNISKMIPNSVLLNSGKIYGTNIITQSKNRLADFREIKLTRGNDIMLNFIRSHSNSISILTRNVIKKSKGVYELTKRSYGLIYLGPNEEDKALKDKYGIRYTDRFGVTQYNSFVKLRIGNQTTLYNIVDDNDRTFLVPVNLLERNENAEWSANPNNNKYPDQDFYSDVIDQYLTSTLEKIDAPFASDVMNAIVEANKDVVETHKAPKQQQKEHLSEIPGFNTDGNWNDTRRTIKNWHDNLLTGGVQTLYMWHAPFSKYVKDFGVANGLVQRVNFEDGSHINVKIYKVSFKSLINKYTGSHFYDPIKAADSRYTNYIMEIRKLAEYDKNHNVSEFFPDIYAIEPTELDANTDASYGINFSTIEDCAVQMAKNITHRGVIDDAARKIGNYYRDLGVVRNSKEIKPTMDNVIITAANYLDTLCSDIETNIKQFIKHPETGEWLSIDNPDAINLIKNDPAKRREYFKKLMEPQTIVEQFGLIKELDIDSEDETLKPYLNKIKKAIEKMQNLPMIANAYKRFAEEYYDKATDNPLVKDNLISVLDGFYKTNWLNAMFNDIQETSNPIIQVAMKNFQQDLRAKQFEAKRQADNFVKHIKELEKKAKEKGEKFSLTSFIDEYGRIKLPYNDKFIDDRNKLQQAVRDAEEGSLEYFKAKLAYDEWKVKHVEQPVVKEYYEQRNEALRTILSYPKTTIDLFIRHEKFRRERANLRNKYSADIEQPEYDAEMERLDNLIRGLEVSYDDEESEPVKKAKARIKEYVTTNRNLERKYFKYDAKHGFEDLVQTNLDIIEKFETSGQPATMYINNPDYVKARTWIRRNVDIEPDWSAEIQGQISEAYDALRTTKSSVLIRTVRGNKKYINHLGLFDPSLIPDDVMEKIKDEQSRLYRLNNEAPMSDRILLNNAPKNDDTVYKASFYKSMTSKESKTNNPRWQKAVTEINDILGKYYNEFTGEVDLNRVPMTEAGIKDLERISELYNELDDIRGPKKSEAVRDFIKKNVDTSAINEEKYNADLIWARSLPKGSQYRTAMLNIILRENGEGEIVANSYLYGYLKPKASKEADFIDADKTKAVRTLKQYKEKRLKSEYAQANYNARHNHSAEEYQQWYDRNHVYNPYTHAYEPLDVWYDTVDKTDKYSYYPKFEQTNRVPRNGYLTHREAVQNLDEYDEEEFPTVKDLESHYFKEEDFVNKNYKNGEGHGSNYIKGSSPDYDNNVDISDTEREAMEYIQNTLMALANTQDAKKYLEKGWLPARRKGKPVDAKGWLSELAKVFGWSNETYDVDAGWYDEVDYSKDKPIQMPMLEKLKGKVDNIRSQEVEKIRKQKEGETDEDYAKYVEETKSKNEQIIKDNNEVHKKLLDNNWLEVLEDFIVRSGTYNAVQDNKYELFFAKELIKRYGAYLPTYNKFGRLYLKRDFGNSTSDDKEYLRKVDENLVGQLDNQLRRILYNQFKAPNNKKLLKIMSTLQSLTSAQFMMLNVKGGIANVTLGESQIVGEAFAREFFNGATWGKSKLYYNASVADYIRHMGDDKANTVAGAIIKFMDIVDYDEHSGVSRLSKDAAEILRKTRDLAYTPQTAGEHGMQNSAMFAMMMSHRLFINDRKDEFGQPKYKYMNYAEFTRENHEKALLSILNEEQEKEYKAFKDRIKADANELKEFAWYQKDVTTEFALTHLNIEERKKFVEAREQLNKNAKKEFNDDAAHPTILSQLDLGEDGKMTFKKDSYLAEIDIPKDNGEPSDAYTLLAGFKGRVISVNKYIHGVYDKSGRAQFEKTFIGSLVMQYHKHLPLGIMKRYRWRGMYSEERGSVVKGTYKSLVDFLSIPINQYKEKMKASNEEVGVLEGAQNILKSVVDFALHFNLAYNMLPEYDRANIRRMYGSVCGVLAAMAVTIAIRLGADDDDEDSLAYNLMLYEADRLATEAAQYFPPTFYTEGKKLWRSPIAAGSGITDLLSSANMIAHMIMEGDEFDGEYKSGKFAGESKLRVYIERRIPIWRGIKTSFIDINTNNSYYKVGENFLGFFNVKERVEEWKK